MEKQLVVRTTQRYNSKEVWEKVNPILSQGEIGIEPVEDTEKKGLFKLKVGDGTTPWNQLEYLSTGGDGTGIEIEIDTTLEKSNQAADAKTTGDAIKALGRRLFVGTIADYEAARELGQIPNGTVVNLLNSKQLNTPEISLVEE